MVQVARLGCNISRPHVIAAAQQIEPSPVQICTQKTGAKFGSKGIFVNGFSTSLMLMKQFFAVNRFHVSFRNHFVKASCYAIQVRFSSLAYENTSKLIPKRVSFLRNCADKLKL